MDETEWNETLAQLAKAADDIAVLSRCLAVQPHLLRWQAAPDNVLEGQLAADGLDQARGDLERLADGRASELTSLVERLLSVLPIPLE